MARIVRHLQLELVQKINTFNEIYMLDCLNPKTQRMWKDYLDPITRYLYNMNYETFLIDNAFDVNAVPGILEMYYNIFTYVLKDLKTVDTFKPVQELLISASDVLRTFHAFLKANHYKLERKSFMSFGVEKFKYTIWPML